MRFLAQCRKSRVSIESSLSCRKENSAGALDLDRGCLDTNIAVFCPSRRPSRSDASAGRRVLPPPSSRTILLAEKHEGKLEHRSDESPIHRMSHL